MNGVHTLEDAAYELIIAGWEIFPLRGKIPWISKADGGQGHLDATSDDRQVREWWTRWPTANIGGRPAETVIAIDLDPRHGGTLQKLISMAGEISPTLRSFSGRGDGGQHLIFDRGDLGEIDRSRLNPLGINVKDHDGYIVLPPSTHPESGQPYRWDTPRPIMPLPEGLKSLLTPQSRVSVPSRHKVAGHVLGGGLINKRLAGMLETVAKLPEGSRNDTVNDLAYRAVTELDLGSNIAVRDLFAEAARQSGLRASEIKATLKSAGFRSRPAHSRMTAKTSKVATLHAWRSHRAGPSVSKRPSHSSKKILKLSSGRRGKCWHICTLSLDLAWSGRGPCSAACWCE